MRKLLILIFLLSAGSIAQAQEVKFGIKLGGGAALSSLRESFTVNTDAGDYKFEEGNLDLSFQVGLTSRIRLLGIYIIPELYFSSVTSEVQFTQIGNQTAKTLSQSMSRIDVPVLVGFRVAKIARLNAGPIASLVINQESGVKNQLAQLAGVDTVTDDPNVFTFGFQAGGGVDLGRLSIDLRYEGNLSWLGSNLTVNGQDYEFDLRTPQVLLSVGLMF